MIQLSLVARPRTGCYVSTSLKLWKEYTLISEFITAEMLYRLLMIQGKLHWLSWFTKFIFIRVERYIGIYSVNSD